MPEVGKVILAYVDKLKGEWHLFCPEVSVL